MIPTHNSIIESWVIYILPRSVHTHMCHASEFINGKIKQHFTINNIPLKISSDDRYNHQYFAYIARSSDRILSNFEEIHFSHPTCHSFDILFPITNIFIRNHNQLYRYNKDSSAHHLNILL